MSGVTESRSRRRRRRGSFLSIRGVVGGAGALERLALCVLGGGARQEVRCYVAGTLRTSLRKGDAVEQRRDSSLVNLALWFALATGAAEDSIVLAHRHLLGEITRVSPHVYWMAPAANMLLFVLAAGALALIGRVWPAARTLRARTFVLTSLGVLALLLVPRWLHPLAALVLALGVGRVASRLIAIHSHGFARLVRRTAIPAALAFVLVALWTAGRDEIRERRAVAALPEASAGAPNVLLLLLDTVRAKSLSLYGYGYPTTPNLERLAEAGVTFDLAISTSPWTLPSHGTMFTGRYPHELGTGFLQPLDARYPTLAEVLTDHGYLTAGFTANLLYTSYVFGLDRGFQHYEDYEVELGQMLLSSSLGRALVTSTWLRNVLGRHELVNRKNAEEIGKDFLSWLEGRVEGRPFFAFLNFFDAHAPYLPPEPFQRMFGPESLNRHLWHFAGLRVGNEARRPDDWLEHPTEAWKDLRAYEGAIAYLDQELGTLLARLKVRGTLDNTIVIVASDHGEQHGEHGLFLHWNSLYMPLLHVPLLVRYPAGVPAGVRVPEPVSLRDLPATVLELAGIPGQRGIPGSSLSRTWRRGQRVPSESAGPNGMGMNGTGGATTTLSELEAGPTFSIVREGFHYIVEPSSRREELYDLARDPDERTDVIGRPENADLLHRLRQEIIRILEGTRAPLLNSRQSTPAERSPAPNAVP